MSPAPKWFSWWKLQRGGRGGKGGAAQVWFQSVRRRASVSCRAEAEAEALVLRGSRGELSVKCSELREPQNPAKCEEYQRRL
eukprot:571609-Prorocentrum_minimum.AAC.7